MDNIPCTYRISVKAVIKDDNGRVLLLREKGGSWELPGGGLEHNEDPKLALKREIHEETGYEVEEMNDQPSAFWTIGREEAFPNGLKWFAFVAYEAKVTGDFRPDNDEAEEAKFFSKEEVSTLKLHDNTKPFFEDWA